MDVGDIQGTGSDAAQKTASDESAVSRDEVGRFVDLALSGLLVTGLGLMAGFLSVVLDPISWAVVPVGGGLLTWGVGQLYVSRSATTVGSVRVLLCLIFSVAVLLLSPYLLWWRWFPRNPYFTWNLIALTGFFALATVSINWVVAGVGRAVRNATVIGEGYYVMVLTLLGWVVPGLLFVTNLVLNARDTGEPLGMHLRDVLGGLAVGKYRLILIALGVLPSAFTCLTLVKARMRLFNGKKDTDGRLTDR